MGDTPPIRRPRASFVPHASIVDIPFKYLIIGVTSLPLFGLLICTFISVWKTYEEVTESVCGVSNFVPSISAVTGITPQLYIWRYLIGFQSGPRLILAAAYYQQHKLYASRLPKPFYFTILAKSALLLHMIDLVSFVGVAYVSNRENFPVHERLFIVFLVSSTMYMGVMLTIYSRLNAEGLLAPRVCC
ncbi:unnamed protein product [Calicophoron daubneyi]|uniref:CWH43-like N-terminal domain-containing protein n=1 Tax=Calicophoron daubneyi TaxID=300641 RepID=A0AAV2TSK9_CALDB